MPLIRGFWQGERCFQDQNKGGEIRECIRKWLTVSRYSGKPGKMRDGTFANRMNFQVSHMKRINLKHYSTLASPGLHTNPVIL